MRPTLKMWHASSRMRWRILCAVLVGWLTAACSPTVYSAVPFQRGDVVVQSTFDEPQSLAAWQPEGNGTITVSKNGNASVLLVNAPTSQGQIVRMTLPVERLRGTRVTLSARVKADDVKKPPVAWNGVKVMFCTVSPDGPNYTSPQDIYGTFDWRTIEVVAVVPSDATEAFLILGIENTSGQVSFDDVKLTVTTASRRRPANRPALKPTAQLDRRTNIPRFRGVMYGTGFKPEEVRDLAKWNANFIRWPLYHWYPGKGHDLRRDLVAYDKWLQEQLAGLDATLPTCQELGIQVLIDLHTPPGSNDAEAWWLFEEKKYQDKFLQVWDHIVARYKNHPAVWGYDLANEPIEGKIGNGLMDWRTLAEVTAKRVRAADPHKAIVVAPGPGGGWANLDVFEPLDVPGIVYSPHFYEPMKMTHQGVINGMPVGVVYPGEVDGKKWDKEALRRAIDPVRQFQLDYNVPILIGEFGVARWAPDGSAERYLRDCIEIWEEYEWDWAYHAYRGWHGWSAEFTTDINNMQPSPTPTSRVLLLQQWMAKNQHAKPK
jgi:endoglucanase